MPEYSDIYVISSKRDAETIYQFLTHFLPKREESADEYEIPQYSDEPKLIYTKDIELINYCCSNELEEHAIYWRSTSEKKPEHAMIYFLKDGNVIYGLSTDANFSDYANQLLVQLKEFLNSSLGYIGHEASPDVENFQEFELQVKAYNN